MATRALGFPEPYTPPLPCPTRWVSSAPPRAVAFPVPTLMPAAALPGSSGPVYLLAQGRCSPRASPGSSLAFGGPQPQPWPMGTGRLG